MTRFELYEHVLIKELGATGKIVDISYNSNNEKYYCIEYDDEFKYLDGDMGIVYLTEEKLEKIMDTELK